MNNQTKPIYTIDKSLFKDELSVVSYLAFHEVISCPLRGMIRQEILAGNLAEAKKLFRRDLLNGGFAAGEISAHGNAVTLKDGRTFSPTTNSVFDRMLEMYVSGYEHEDFTSATPLASQPGVFNRVNKYFYFTIGDIQTKCEIRMIFLKYQGNALLYNDY